MSNSKGFSHALGQFVGRHPLGVAVGAALLVAAILGWNWESNRRAVAEEARVAEQGRAIAQQNRLVADAHARELQASLAQQCGTDFSVLARPAAALVKAGKGNEAFAMVKACAQYAAAPANVKEFIAAAQEVAFAEDARNRRIQQDAQAALNKKQDVAEKAARRKEGVSVGMSKNDALASAWGRPEKVNRTTNQYGTREQWVYGGHNYLYFENDKLTSIQN